MARRHRPDRVVIRRALEQAEQLPVGEVGAVDACDEEFVHAERVPREPRRAVRAPFAGVVARERTRGVQVRAGGLLYTSAAADE